MPTALDQSTGLAVRPAAGPPPAVLTAGAAPVAVPPARRGGRAGLTPAAVVAEAARVADEARDARVPLATVADRLGVRLPSLYKHIAGAEGLRRGLGRLAAEGLRAALDEALGVLDAEDTRDDADTDADGAAPAGASARSRRLTAVATAYRAWAAERPGLYLALATAPHPDDPEHAAAVAAVTQRLVEVVVLYGASGDDDVLDGVRLLRSALHGFASLEGTGGHGVPDAVDRTFARLVALLDAGLAAPAPQPATSPVPQPVPQSVPQSVPQPAADRV
ncbi:TetR/AcrR family transcriptional regulator [Kineosporia sp. A_224]|uniref:TetR/AcrR family transcriptional regulator n=1 Tax=Kineosporia sp. A_224 TaxID=1962180 RepID=UPI0018E9FB7C|nr:TetR-like C-terminal domain-containing protein [Kineosporia sp. A_224]